MRGRFTKYKRKLTKNCICVLLCQFVSTIFIITIEEIKKLGLPEKETKVYWAMFRLGSGFPSTIAKEAGVNRATAYEILNRLHLKGLVMKMVKRNKYFFSCTEPEAFREYISSRQKSLENQKQEYERMLPELSYFYSNNIYKPRIYFYEGMEGIRELFKFFIFFYNRIRSKNEILYFCTLSLQINLCSNYHLCPIHTMR